MKRKQMAILLVLIAILVLLIIFAPAIKSSILVGTLVPRKMTLADVKERMGTTCYNSNDGKGAYYGWYLPNGKFLRCGFDGIAVQREGATEDDLLLEEVFVYDEPKAGWLH